MRNTIIILFLLLSVAVHAEQRADILGDGFTAERFAMGRDYSGEICSTLVRAQPIVEGRDAILYIHGYNDYFFQADMARRFQDSSYNFYAVDLRRYGRSLMPDQTPFEVRDLREYFADIDSALQVIKQEGSDRVVVMGHSTGGLIASYYVGSLRGDGVVDGLILNSPFFAQNVSWALQNILLPVVSTLGRFCPDVEVIKSTPSLYFESLHKSRRGEWEFDPALKLEYSEPITTGWIRAIDLAQSDVQQGYSLTLPILLMYSDNSVYADRWSDDMMRGDAVLNVEHIAKYGDKLGENVTHAEIKDGMHDLILSGYEAREMAYDAMFKWLDKNFE